MANSFNKVFEPHLLTKKFIKKDAKLKNIVPNSTENIDNTVKGKLILFINIGLFNYLTASNIRHKIKHPLWLAMKFPVGIQLYLRKSDFEILNEEDLIRKIHETVVDSVKNPEVLQEQDTKLCLSLNIQSTKEHVMHVKKICEKIALLESKNIQILIEEDKILENFFKLDINPKLIKAYTNLYNELALQKEREPCDFMDDEEQEPRNYGDQSYDQRASVHVLNNETLEIEYNMTEMNFFSSKLLDDLPPDFNNDQGSNRKTFAREQNLNKRNMIEFDQTQSQNNPLDPNIQKKDMYDGAFSR